MAGVLSFKAMNAHGDGQLTFANGCVHLRVFDLRPARSTHKKDVAAQSATLDFSLHLAGGCAVRVGEQDALQWQRDDQETQPVSIARAAGGSDIDIAAGKANLAGFGPIDENLRIRIQILDS